LLKLIRGKSKFAKITRGVNLNLLKLQGGEIFHEGPKPKKIQIIKMKFKKNILHGENQK